jgi:hypothetical protein
MVKVELEQKNYGSVYDFAVSRCCSRPLPIHTLSSMCVHSGWVKRTIDPAFQASTPTVTTAESTNATDSSGATGSSLNIESSSAVSDSGIKITSDAVAI